MAETIDFETPSVVSRGRVARGAVSVLIAATMVCVAGGAAAASSATPSSSDVLRPWALHRPAGHSGTMHRTSGLSLRVQPIGVTVWGEALRADGESVIVGLRSDPDGRTAVLSWPGAHDDHDHGHAAASASIAAAVAAKGPCSDGANSTYGTRWGKVFRWRFKASTRPGGFNKAGVTAALKNAVINITGGHNNCNQADQVGARHSYLGTTFKVPGIGASSSCGRHDGVNTVAFGNLGRGDLAMTCWWTVGGKVVEADVKLNKSDYRWAIKVRKGCSRRYSIEAVATHEFGHVFGLGHVSEGAHPALTMSPTIRPCQRSETSLGLGDLRGLERKY